MKRLTFAILTVIAAVSCSRNTGWTSLTQDNHPRLFADDKEFAAIKGRIEAGKDAVLTKMHGDAMNLALQHGLCPDKITYRKDESGKRILSVSRETITRIFSAAYAYRYTGEIQYLQHAEWDINTVCAFGDWNPTHYLDCAEMATAVAIGYDWLYRDLQDSTKAHVLEALREKAFTTADNETFTWWKTFANNWNQVCNTGLTVAALATFEEYPEWARQFISDNIESNRKAMEGIYPPEGAYFEGPVYWNYGNMYQTMMLSALETTLGTDFGLGDVPGFNRTGLFEAFLDGNTNQLFNYSDNLAERIPLYPLWYLAWRFDRPEILFREQSVVFRRPYVHIECERFLPLYIIYAAKADPSSIRQPEEKTLFADGPTPVAVVRTGWDDNDQYLAMKGGSPGSNHAHMDCGSFIFDSDGARWAADLSRQEYVELENPCKKLGGDFWDMSQNSVRWRCFRFGVERHNTLAVNGRQQNVDGKAVMTGTFDTPERKGATFDLSSLYSPDLSSAERTIELTGDGALKVTDRVAAPAGAPAHIRWTLVTQSDPEINAGGITLTANGIEMQLSVSGADVEFRHWPSDPYFTDRETAFFDFPVDEPICGYEYDLPAGEAREVITILKRVN